QDITWQLYQAEILLLVGSDSGELLSPHGLATHKEMELMQQAGLPTIAVLRAATINAAKALEKESQLGKVAIGFNADLILSKHNPLENLTTLQNPDAVVKQGRLFPKSELEQLRQKAIDERSFWQEMNTLRKVGEF
ncbi:MAG TPA: amidohydrolase family protein, partial [Cellvibrio sp.]